MHEGPALPFPALPLRLRLRCSNDGSASSPPRQAASARNGRAAAETGGGLEILVPNLARACGP